MSFGKVVKGILLALCLLMVATITPSHAGYYTLTSGNSTVDIDDASLPGSSPGVYSWLVDSGQRISQQAFYYRVGTIDPEKPLSGNELDPAANFTVTASNQTASSVTLTFTEVTGKFSVKVVYDLTGGTTGSGLATLRKQVTLTNLTASPLDFHFFSYSDYDLVTRPAYLDNATIANGRAIQSGYAATTDTIGKGVTVAESSTLSPTRYGIASDQFADLANGVSAYNLDNSVGPYLTPGDMQFAFQWDMTLNPGTPVTFTISDDSYPTKTLFFSKSALPSSCVDYGQTFTNTYTYDNTRNLLTPINNIKITEKLARDIAFISATNGGSFDPATGTVNWNLPPLAAGAAQQTVQATFRVDSASDFSMASKLLGDEVFPSFLSTKSVLCNHPPTISSTPLKTGKEGQAYSYQVTAYDNDAATSLRYYLDSPPAGMVINETSGLITWTPTAAQTGNNVITVRVSDGTLSTTQVYTLFIAYINVAPSIVSSPVTSAYVGVSYPYTVAATDANISQGDKITFALPTAPAGMTIDSATGIINWIPTAAQVGSNNVVVQVTDNSGLYSQQSFTVTVNAATKTTPTINWAAPSAITYG
ncbi:MAG: hypothetical protein EG828_11620, partial [Deltaproteobacteria bacterium]|nr:hypothetical protein [Deltaproteobacteria bacterium]